MDSSNITALRGATIATCTLLSVAGLAAPSILPTATAASSFTLHQVSGDVVTPGAELDLPPVDPTARIVGGEPAPADNYQWMAKVLIKTARGTYGCGGSFISADIVLTAQHCVKNNIDSISIKYGNHTWRQGKDVAVVNYAAGEGIKKGDWAVLKLATPLPDVPTLSLAKTASYNNGPQFRAAGWGALRQQGPTAPSLMHVTLPAITDADCGTGPEEICAGDLANGGIDTCQGDSGGPLVATNSGKDVQVGIVSWGVGCAQAGKPGHYTEVSTYLADISTAIHSLQGQPATIVGDSTPGTTPAPTTTPANPATPGTPQQPTPTTPNTTPTTPTPTATRPVDSPQQPMRFREATNRYLYNYGTTTSRLRSTKADAKSVKIHINLTHRCANHLRISVITPNGKRNMLKQATFAQGQNCQLWAGDRAATYQLSTQSSGVWTLQVTDMFAGHPGKIASWGIDLS